VVNLNRAIHFQHGLFGNVGTVAEIIICFEAKQTASFISSPFDQPFDGSSLSFQIGFKTPAVTRPISIIPIIMPDFFWAPKFGRVLIFDAVFFEHGRQCRLGKPRFSADWQFANIHNHRNATTLQQINEIAGCESFITDGLQFSHATAMLPKVML